MGGVWAIIGSVCSDEQYVQRNYKGEPLAWQTEFDALTVYLVEYRHLYSVVHLSAIECNQVA